VAGLHTPAHLRLGSCRGEDELVYEDPQHPLRFHFVGLTDDERFLVLSISDRGQPKLGNALYIQDLTAGDTEFSPLIGTITDESFAIVDGLGDRLLMVTDQDAPNRQLVLIDPKNPAADQWQTIIPEQPEPLEGVSFVGGKLFATYLKDVTTRVYVYRPEGTLEREITLPGLGTVNGFDGQADDDFTFYIFTSHTTPPTIYRYDITTGKSTIFRSPAIAFEATDYETRQVFYPSSDGTQIPMFLIHQKGLKFSGDTPTYLYAYGGFNYSLVPAFNAKWLPLLEQGMVVAIANIRGGGEYGRTWHETAIREHRPKAFQDFIAAAEYLIDEGYTNSERLAIEGRSNGGLLVGAVVNLRPDLFQVALPGVGVMDMLRFQKFTVGWNWIAEFGSSENNAEEFATLYNYSPLHNIRADAPYPATFIVTADHDDRVVPAHSFKYAATLQAQHSGDNPILIRIGTKSGHGASSLTKGLEETADIYAFMFHHLGVEL
ncbi:MAG: prolyl oligopeptidase family serine peptidase, partial [Cyanobacteria bacterium J06607_6]